MTDAVYWCEHALVDGQVQPAVTVVVVDGRFTSVTSNSAPGASHRLAGLTVPGLANAHSHAFHRALRGRTQTERGSFWTWRDTMYGVAARLDPDTYHELATAVFAEMACAGITTVGEFHYLHHQADGTPYANRNAMGDALLAAAQRAGVRITLLDTLYLHGGLGPGGYAEPTEIQQRYSDGDHEAWAARVDELEAPSDTQRIGAAVHSVRAVDPDAIGFVAGWARERAAPIHAHLAEQPAETEQCIGFHGVGPTALLDRCGLLGSNFTAVHATHLTAGDIDVLGTSESFACFCPTTERDLGDGIGPSMALHDAGVRLCLGSDSHAVIDILEETRALEMHQRLLTRRRGVHSSTQLIDAMTVHGAASLGWSDVGRIAIDQRADLVSISLETIRTAGARPEPEAAIFAGSAADVTDVIVDGRPIVTDGRHSTIDVAGTLASAIEAVMP